MSTKRDKDEWTKRKDLDQIGYEPRPKGGIYPHNSNETPKHFIVKALVGFELFRQRGSSGFDTEVNGPGGRVDVLDLGPTDEPMAVYEVETNLSRSAKLEKVDQYARGPLPEERVYFLDPTELPDRIPDLVETIEREVV